MDKFNDLCTSHIRVQLYKNFEINSKSVKIGFNII